MRTEIIHSERSARLGQGLLLSLAFWLSCGIAQAAPYNVYYVGNSTACDYQSLRNAISDASAQVDGTVELRLTYSETNSLGYSWNGNNSEVQITNPGANIRIYGGYASCSAAAPTVGNYTTLKYNNASIDAAHTLLSISNSYTSGARQRVTLKQIRMEGAFDDSFGGAYYGGGLSIAENVEVVLDDSKITGFHATQGGGIFVGTLAEVDPSLYPQVNLDNNSAVDTNTASEGGGIYALFGRVRLAGASVSGNTASLNGGGIYIRDLEDAGNFNESSNVALMIENSSAPLSATSISSNTAGSASYSSGSGYGGGIFSRYGHIDFKSQTGILAETAINSNKANFGGGIYIEGSSQAAGGPFTLARIYSSVFASNSARSRGGALYLKNAVDANFHGSGGPCGVGLGRRALCSGFFNNMVDGSDGGGILDRGGAMFLVNERVDGASRPIVRVYGNMFDGNGDPNGRVAVAAAGGTGAGVGSKMIFNRNIFINNSASGNDSVLISSLNGVDLNFRYNTVLDSNTSSRMLAMKGGEVDVTGSILWGTPNRSFPFHFVWFPTAGATMKHSGCLLVRASDDGTTDIPNPSQLWAAYAPQLDARYAPRGGSPAIDHCDDIGGAPPVDAYGNGVYDVPGIAERWGNVDLGAVEQTDIIFASIFGNRPEN